MRLTGKSQGLLLERMLVAAFYLYIVWYKQIWGDNPLILYGTVGLLTCCVLARIITMGYLYARVLPPMLRMYIFYALYSFLGVFVAKNSSAMLSSIVTYVCFVIVCFDCWYISFRLGNNGWIFRILRIAAIVCALQVILAGKPYDNGVIVTTMSSINNPNGLAVVLLIGILSFAVDIKPEKLLPFIFALLADAMMLYGIVLSGSRKCLLAAVPVLLYWLITYMKTLVKAREYKQLFFSIFIISAALAVCLVYIKDEFQGTAAFKRIMLLFEEGGVDTREGLYRDAFEYFKTSPLIGIGFDQYRFWSPHGYYSHSSYAEILSCGGLVGVLLFFIPLLKCLISCVKLSFSRGRPDAMYRIRMVTLMLVCELFLGIGQIFIYEIPHLLLLMLISMEERKAHDAALQGDNTSQERIGNRVETYYSI